MRARDRVDLDAHDSRLDSGGQSCVAAQWARDARLWRKVAYTGVTVEYSSGSDGDGGGGKRRTVL